MKIIKTIIGILIILLGNIILSINILNDQFANIVLKIIGFCIVVGGIYYLIKIAWAGKQ